MGRIAKRSPLKDKPIRVAGQSLDEEIQAVLSEDAHAIVAGAAVVIVLAALEWLRWLYPFSRPVPMTIVATAAAVWACWKVRKARRTIENLKLGRDGERIVGEFLERMREGGYRVFHDIVAPSFNLDHVLVGPQGIFLIETKTRSKPVGKDLRVEYDGHEIKIGGVKPDRDPVWQAEASAAWLTELLQQTLERQYFVRPVVLYLGWYIDDTQRKGPALVWVLNPKALRGFIDREPVRLSSADVGAIAFHLSRYVVGTLNGGASRH